MKVKMLLDGEKPKVSPQELKRVIAEAGAEVTTRRAEFGVAVGGDGLFSKVGRSETIPLLFVGVRSSKSTGSKAYMAQVYFDELSGALKQIMEGRHRIKEHPRLEVFKNGRSLGEVFTDVYLQRGDESNSLRYRLRVTTSGEVIEEAAIGDGVVITTSAGSTGYYSYPDRMKEEALEMGAHSRISDDRVGVCHIIPTYVERTGTTQRLLRYSVPWGSKIEVWTTRPAHARLFGGEAGRSGTKITTKDRVSVVEGKRSTRLVLL